MLQHSGHNNCLIVWMSARIIKPYHNCCRFLSQNGGKENCGENESAATEEKFDWPGKLFGRKIRQKQDKSAECALNWHAGGGDARRLEWGTALQGWQLGVR